MRGVYLCPIKDIHSDDEDFVSVAPVRQCNPDSELRCGDGSCVDIRRRCDGRLDCNDGIDERNCGMNAKRKIWFLQVL